MDIYIELLKKEGHFGSENKILAKVYQNLLMQLRKACNHPYLFHGVEDTNAPQWGDHIIDNCGKMKFVDKLLANIS